MANVTGSLAFVPPATTATGDSLCKCCLDKNSTRHVGSRAWATFDPSFLPQT